MVRNQVAAISILLMTSLSVNADFRDGYTFMMEDVKQATTPEEKFEKNENLLSKVLLDSFVEANENEAGLLLLNRKALCPKMPAQCLQLKRFVQTITTRDKWTEKKRTIYEKEMNEYWLIIADNIKTPADASKVIAQFKPINLRSPTTFHFALEFLVNLVKKKWLVQANELSAWMRTTYKQIPKISKIEPEINFYSEALNTVRHLSPKAIETGRNLALMGAGWMTPEFMRQMPSFILLPTMERMSQLLQEGGRVDVTASLVGMVPGDMIMQDLQWISGLGEQYCVHMRNIGKVDACEAWVNRVQKMGDFKHMKIAIIPQERARIHLERGQYDQARAIYLKNIAEVPETKQSSMQLAWLYYDLSQMEYLVGNMPAAEKALENHWRLLQQASPEGVPARERMPRFMALTGIQIRQGNLTEAKKNLESALQSLKQDYMGVSKPEINGVMFRLQIAAAERNQAAMKRDRDLIEKLVADFKDLQLLLPLANALVKASNGTYVDADLEPVEKVVGSKSIVITEYRAIIATVLKARGAKANTVTATTSPTAQPAPVVTKPAPAPSKVPNATPPPVVTPAPQPKTQ